MASTVGSMSGERGRTVATIKDVARIAGVSSAMVSRYLNDGYVSAEKRQGRRGLRLRARRRSRGRPGAPGRRDPRGPARRVPRGRRLHRRPHLRRRDPGSHRGHRPR
ncbi:LacI family DNA-binding transcriptional regulator [Granulimonas faecalis]|uniref:LacI family DNA-binding transcriptional regulator n=2 Tax=Coriobacteriales TaxID=84999 RepID=UPI00283A93CB|nr:LacI family DNA-binding transcriptional regulator [Granulimonas faecalis]